MIAVFVNVATVIIGSTIGIIFRNKIKQQYLTSVIYAIGLVTLVIGVMSAVETASILTVIICLALGTLLGEAVRIDDRIENAGDFIKGRLFKNGGESRFTEGFVSASILFCVGSLTIMGSLEAGINNDYSIIFAKSTLDLVSSLVYGAAMGVGVTFAAAFVLVFQGALTLLSGAVQPFLTEAVVTEMSAVGGVILLGQGLNMLNVTKERIKVANMLPGIFLPVLYMPVSGWVAGLL